MLGMLRRLGRLTINGVWQLGFIARFFWLILVYSGQSFTRLHLTIRELYFSGVLSLLIILVSGLFVGSTRFCWHGRTSPAPIAMSGTTAQSAGVRFWSWGCRLKTSILKSARNCG